LAKLLVEMPVKKEKYDRIRILI